MNWLWAPVGFLAGLGIGWFLAYRWNARLRLRYGKLLSFALHEVNTPLTALHMTVLNFLQGIFGPMSKDQETWMKVVGEQTSRMSHLLRDVRDLLHLEFHRDLKSHLEPLSLETLLRNELSRTESSMARAGVKVSLEAASNLPDVQADKDQVQRIISSLLANARKFQSGGRVFVSLRELPPEPQEAVRHLELGVSYQGLKMAFSEARQVLDLFYPVERRRDSEVLPCVGLGLGFCRILLERQGGSLSLEVDDGGVSHIRARLPVASLSGTIS